MYRRILVLPIAIIALLAIAASASAATPQISASGRHTCALLPSGVVKCFGSNQHGQLGNTSNIDTSNPNPTPTTVDLGAAATYIAAAQRHTCAIVSGAIVKCFGSNQYGQLGHSTNIGGVDPNPTTVNLGAEATQITGGEAHTCVLLAGGTVKCFGANGYGQLGVNTNIGTYDPTPTPQTVDLGAAATEISAGRYHTCALLVTGVVSCFGYNQQGQLGRAANFTNSDANAPAATVDLGATAVRVVAGDLHTCVALTGGTVNCFGNNTGGQLGNTPTGGNSYTPFLVNGLVAEDPKLAAGDRHTCALLATGALKCFGSNFVGQLGTSDNLGLGFPNTTPLTVDLGSAASQVVAGYKHTCALLVIGAVKCFGNNNYGQLGNATNNTTDNPNSVPTTVAGLDLSVPATPTPTPTPVTPLAASFAAPKWKVRRSGKNLNLSARAVLQASGIDAAKCSGKVAVTAKPAKPKSAKSISIGKFALSFKDGTCQASVKGRVRTSAAARGLAVTFRLTDSTTLTASPRTSKPKTR